MLSVRKLNSGYGFLQVLWDVSLEIQKGEFVGVIGPNGAGKTTLLKSIVGLLSSKEGDISFLGNSIFGMPTSKVTRQGLSYISENLNLFTGMSVKDNLLLGAFSIKDEDIWRERLGFVYELFPRLKEREKQLAGTMSGGERKMLAIARGIMANPKMILVDEPSLGLAPNLVKDVFFALQKLQGYGVTILLVEQLVNATLHIIDRAYVLEGGRIVMEGKSSELLDNPHVRKAYLGV